MKKYREEHKEEIRIARKKYRDKDINKFNEANRMYQRKRRKKYKENAELVIKYKEVLDKIKELTLQRKHCEDLFGGKQKTINDKILELLEEIE